MESSSVIAEYYFQKIASLNETSEKAKCEYFSNDAKNLCCLEYIPALGKGWHFHAVGFSIPMEQGADRTIQSDKPTIESLRRISLDGPTFAVDQFNQSKPTIRFPEDLCKEPDKERNKLVTFIAASIISVSVLLIFLSFLALVLCSNCPRNKNEQNNSLQNGKGTKTDSGYVPSELLNEDTGMADNNPEGNEESSL